METVRRIRNSAKALIIKDGKILLSKMDDGEIYYILPGGGQEPEELLPEAVKRECREELSVDVEPISLSFIVEGLHGERFHRVDLIFLCRYLGETTGYASHYDEKQVGTAWLDVENLMNEPLYPSVLREQIIKLYRREPTQVYLGDESMVENP
jgi:ADP-ribose pyrophosphatase YjhB (NUDIX family)